MRFYFNPDNLCSAIATLLRDNAVLQGANYLNGVLKVFVGRAPTGAAAPYLVVWNLPLYQGDSTWDGEIRIACYTPLLVNGQVDPKGNTILAKCEELLADETVTVAGMTVQPLVSRGIVPSLFDPETDKSKARGVLRVFVRLGYNP